MTVAVMAFATSAIGRRDLCCRDDRCNVRRLQKRRQFGVRQPQGLQIHYYWEWWGSGYSACNGFLRRRRCGHQGGGSRLTRGQGWEVCCQNLGSQEV